MTGPTTRTPWAAVAIPPVDGGLCAEIDPELFFPGKGENTKVRAAKRVCASCPVQARCREWAVSWAEPYGIWGGLSSRERRRVQRSSGSRGWAS